MKMPFLLVMRWLEDLGAWLPAARLVPGIT
jgi:hypothetical protein